MYDQKVLKAFLENQSRLYKEPVADNEEEAEEFLEDTLAVVCKNIKEVRKYMDEEGMDVFDMSDVELLEAAEVFAVGDGRFLVVEA